VRTQPEQHPLRPVSRFGRGWLSTAEVVAHSKRTERAVGGTMSTTYAWSAGAVKPESRLGILRRVGTEL